MAQRKAEQANKTTKTVDDLISRYGRKSALSRIRRRIQNDQISPEEGKRLVDALKKK